MAVESLFPKKPKGGKVPNGEKPRGGTGRSRPDPSRRPKGNNSRRTKGNKDETKKKPEQSAYPKREDMPTGQMMDWEKFKEWIHKNQNLVTGGSLAVPIGMGGAYLLGQAGQASSDHAKGQPENKKEKKKEKGEKGENVKPEAGVQEQQAQGWQIAPEGSRWTGDKPVPRTDLEWHDFHDDMNRGDEAERNRKNPLWYKPPSELWPEEKPGVKAGPEIELDIEEGVPTPELHPPSGDDGSAPEGPAPHAEPDGIDQSALFGGRDRGPRMEDGGVVVIPVEDFLDELNADLEQQGLKPLTIQEVLDNPPPGSVISRNDSGGYDIFTHPDASGPGESLVQDFDPTDEEIEAERIPTPEAGDPISRGGSASTPMNRDSFPNMSDAEYERIFGVDPLKDAVPGEPMPGSTSEGGGNIFGTKEEEADQLAANEFARIKQEDREAARYYHMKTTMTPEDAEAFEAADPLTKKRWYREWQTIMREQGRDPSNPLVEGPFEEQARQRRAAKYREHQERMAAGAQNREEWRADEEKKWEDFKHDRMVQKQNGTPFDAGKQLRIIRDENEDPVTRKAALARLQELGMMSPDGFELPEVPVEMQEPEVDPTAMQSAQQMFDAMVGLGAGVGTVELKRNLEQQMLASPQFQDLDEAKRNEIVDIIMGNYVAKYPEDLTRIYTRDDGSIHLPVDGSADDQKIRDWLSYSNVGNEITNIIGMNDIDVTQKRRLVVDVLREFWPNEFIELIIQEHYPQLTIAEEED